MKEEISEEEFAKHRHWATELHASHFAKHGYTGMTGLRYIFNPGSKAYSGSFDPDTIKPLVARLDNLSPPQ